MNDMMQNWQLSFRVLKEDAQKLEDYFDEKALSVSAFEVEKGALWRFDLVLDGEPHLAQFEMEMKAQGVMSLSALQAEPIVEIDWLEASYKQFPAFEWDGYYLFGAHIDPKTCPDHLIPLQIGAARAFGSGEHATTKGCLSLLNHLADEKLISQDSILLDMGCGSGILAIAAAKKLAIKNPIIGVDIDDISVLVAAENSHVNHVPDQVHFVHGDGFQAECLAGKQFDLVLANILANPLIEMVPQMAKASKKGYLILSGLLQTQEQEVIEAYEAAGFELIKTCPIEEWQALLMKQKRSA